MNIPSGASGLDLSRDCADLARRCAPWAISHYWEILANQGASPTERLEALKFLSHFVADLHQPLHAGRPEDLGGNRVRVSFFGDRGTGAQPMQLHRIWDTELLVRGDIAYPGSTSELVAEISPADVAAWSNADVVSWANESYRIDESFVYPEASSDVAQQYFAPAVVIVRQRLKQGAVRLAFVLNEAARGRSASPN